ncbi:MAG: pyridoxal phosphate-dependent decarboxylase family protein [Phycicoccus sp.]
MSSHATAEIDLDLLSATVRRAHRYDDGLAGGPVVPTLHTGAADELLATLDVEHGIGDAALDLVARLLTEGVVHTGHPRYFGLFNPAPAAPAVAAQLLVATVNPQLAAWSHAPAVNAAERWALHVVADRLGMPCASGSFTSGGAEANATAVHLALTRALPEAGRRGLAGGPAPVMYASAESHLAWLKIAHTTGVGRDQVRLVPTDSRHRMRPDVLVEAITADRSAGLLPALGVGTAGTTAAGAVDPLPELAELADEAGAWFHVDAAWAGAVAFSDRMRPLLTGVERADSVTVDAHKWLSVPMGAGMVLTRHADVLAATYQVSTAYMPDAGDKPDPYTHSAQWSRRAAGMQLVATLAGHGVAGYAELVERHTALGDRLRAAVTAAGLTVVNDTPLPVVCVAVPGRDAAWHRALAAAVVDSGRAWVSYATPGGTPSVRACITSLRTEPSDVDALVELLVDTRTALGAPRR